MVSDRRIAQFVKNRVPERRKVTMLEVSDPTLATIIVHSPCSRANSCHIVGPVKRLMDERISQAQSEGMDEAELRVQLEQHHTASHGWALSCCSRAPDLAEDALQTAYLKILQGRARYNGRAAFKTWLFAVIRTTAADERRRQWLRCFRLS